VGVSNIELRVDGRNAVRELTRVNKATNLLQSSVGKLGVRFAQFELVRRYFKGFVEADKAAAAVRTLGVNSEKLQRQLLAVSNETKGLVSQTQLLEASYDVASAGFNDAASAANILKAATLGAVGGLSDLNTVADATTSVLNAYGLSSDKASKIVDGFIQTQNDGKIVVAQYAQQIGRVAPIAAAAGVGMLQYLQLLQLVFLLNQLLLVCGKRLQV
jgi:TP901 family phage tail tape measure protein